MDRKYKTRELKLKECICVVCKEPFKTRATRRPYCYSPICCSEFAKRNNRENHRKNRNAWMFALFPHGVSCSKCGYDTHKEALDFHHIDPSTKTIVLSQLFSSYAITSDRMAAVKKELENIQILCSNCHRVLHAELDSTL